MSDFISHFNNIADPRVERCKRHERMDILFLSISAVLYGAEGWEEIEDFGQSIRRIKALSSKNNGYIEHLSTPFFAWIAENPAQVCRI